jgi:hypothetical protein
MKKSFTSILMALAGALLFSACEKCVNPTISEITIDEAAWMMQERGDKLIFKNEKGERVRYDVTAKQSQTVFPEGVSMEDDCIERLDTQAILIMQDSTTTLPQLAIYLYKSLSDLEVRLAVQNGGDHEINENTPVHATKEINGVTFSNVYELSPVTPKENDIKKIFFNKEHGFLYVEYNNGAFIERES